MLVPAHQMAVVPRPLSSRALQTAEETLWLCSDLLSRLCTQQTKQTQILPSSRYYTAALLLAGTHTVAAPSRHRDACTVLKHPSITMPGRGSWPAGVFGVTQGGCFCVS